jgi:tetratricopeptide (TPR) repeat protein
VNMEATLHASIVAYLKSKLATVPDPDALSVGIDVLIEAFGVDSVAIDGAPSLLESFAAGRAAQAGGSAESAAAASSSTASPLFQKFLESVRQKGFFSGTVEGTPEYNERYKKVVAKFEERVAAESSAKSSAPGGASALGRADEAGAEAAKEAGNKHVSAQRYAQAIECYSEAIEKAPASK